MNNIASNCVIHLNIIFQRARLTMRRSRFSITLLAILAVFTMSAVLPSCGSNRAYWGVEGDYYNDGYYRPYGKHKPHKEKKHKKYKKHKKHKKHGRHHDHDDDDDD